MTTSLFVDTSGWASFFIQDQPHYPQALQALSHARTENHRIITTNYIIAELVALLHSPLRLPRSRIFSTINSIKSRPYIQIIHIDPFIDQAAWELCQNRPDKPWSLVDCSSFIIMQQHNTQQALTNDHHFEQAGFIRLLNASTP
ncbi:PIN domain-containing protein [Nodosilinea sp. P-1105]|uniref:type II toxin-antitoxin system VapC family toxin n=1 Tax=Nodosilinea sp. P-1105 TaxID=2546229 RepID=UPI00146F4731|nr:PIN domain-containing protein [Nodosilinea sp. P-1105]NMF85815.1 PIN domain-containing protein [Nodosilinea sp. P-1105]